MPFVSSSESGNPDLSERSDSHGKRPLEIEWRFLGLFLLFLAPVILLSLLSYHASDVTFLYAPSETTLNWMGRFGASLGYRHLLSFGLASYLFPFYFLWIGYHLLQGRRIQWRILWGFLTLLFLCALLQFGNNRFAAVLSSPALNIAPNAGGGFGYLLNHEGAWLRTGIGSGWLALLYSILFTVSLLFWIGPRALSERIRKLQEKRRELLENAEDEAVNQPSALERDDLKMKFSREQRRSRRREQRQARRDEALLESDEADATEEKERLKAEKAAERERLKTEREAERQRLKEEKRLEKERLKAEKEARKNAAKEMDPDDEAIFTGGRVPRKPAAPPVPPSGFTPPVPAPPAPPPAAHVSAGAAASVFEGPDSVQFELAPNAILKPVKKENIIRDEEEIRERSRIIEETLAEFNIAVSVTNVVCGPVITRYELRPAPGVRVDRLTGYHDNLQMKLRALSLRIISPIPGKDVIGIEVPNRARQAVPLRGIADTLEWKTAVQKMSVPLLLGKDIDGQPVIADLAKMPHMIVAGSTGSGKSVCLNSILSGIMLSRTPEQLRLILVDPKMVEFTPYADLPHLAVPVITEAPKVAVCLQWAIEEMNRRLQLFRQAKVRNIIDYNKKPAAASLFEEEVPSEKFEKLPYLVIIIDEMSDLMMLNGADVEPRIVRLAQLARAAGIHLILATQRPDVKVITGKIKANIPARIAFKVVGAINSVAILDAGGAEELIGQGDMLFMNPATNDINRAQGCWIDDEDIATLTGFYRSQGEPVYVSDIKEKLDRIKVKTNSGTPIKGIEDEADTDAESGNETAGKDEQLLAKALEVIVSSNRASTSLLQRKLGLGYNRASRIMEELEDRGCVGPANGSSPREILRTSLSGEIPEDAFAPSGEDQNDF